MGLKSNAGKVRRKVIVRGKKKTYSKTMMVRAQNLGMKAMHKELKQERLDKRNVPMEKRLFQQALGHKDPINRLDHAGQYAGLFAGANLATHYASKHAHRVSSPAGAFALGVGASVLGGLAGGWLGKTAGRAASAHMSEDAQRRWARRTALVGAGLHVYTLGSLIRSSRKLRN
ncbi:MAG: hypothetical protein E6Q97_19565 [Desulfurellales bacterium]|nr:MAG: hypothetical protein E6Q97_19565 [Desulfurellales bacterium]